MANHYKVQFAETYATESNAHKAVARAEWLNERADLRYIVVPEVVGGVIRFGVLFFYSEIPMEFPLLITLPQQVDYD